jgi:hypothetical protein
VTWVKVDDGLYDHPKFMRVSNAAVGLWTRALAYCGRHNLDGRVPRRFVELHGTPEEARELLDVNLWIDRGDEIEIKDFLKFNPSKRQVEREKKATRERQKKWRESRDRNGVTNSPSTQSTRDGSGRVSIGAGEEPPTTTDDQHAVVARELFEHWQRACRHPTAKFTRDRQAKIKARLAEGYTPDDIRAAIDGAARGAFTNDQGVRFDDLELICRSGSKLESFLHRRDATPGHRNDGGLAERTEQRRQRLAALQAQREEQVA